MMSKIRIPTPDLSVMAAPSYSPELRTIFGVNDERNKESNWF